MRPAPGGDARMKPAPWKRRPRQDDSPVGAAPSPRRIGAGRASHKGFIRRGRRAPRHGATEMTVSRQARPLRPGWSLGPQTGSRRYLLLPSSWPTMLSHSGLGYFAGSPSRVAGAGSGGLGPLWRCSRGGRSGEARLLAQGAILGAPQGGGFRSRATSRQSPIAVRHAPACR